MTLICLMTIIAIIITINKEIDDINKYCLIKNICSIFSAYLLLLFTC